jgi:hypothetical protein
VHSHAVIKMQQRSISSRYMHGFALVTMTGISGVNRSLYKGIMGI